MPMQEIVCILCSKAEGYSLHFMSWIHNLPLTFSLPQLPCDDSVEKKVNIGIGHKNLLVLSIGYDFTVIQYRQYKVGR